MIKLLNFKFQIPKTYENGTKIEGEVQLSYNITQLRQNSNYITLYVNWFLLLTTGIIPMAALIFLNSRIYAKILETRRLRERCRIRSSTVIALQTRNQGWDKRIGILSGTPGARQPTMKVCKIQRVRFKGLGGTLTVISMCLGVSDAFQAVWAAIGCGQLNGSQGSNYGFEWYVQSPLKFSRMKLL